MKKRKEKNMNMNKTTLLLFILVLGCTSANGWDVKSHLSTMTPYKYSLNGANESYSAPAGCEQVYIEAVFRHGSRYPTSGAIKEIATLEKLIRSFNKSLKLPWMKTWTNPFDASNSGRLSETGIQEHYDLGTRYAKRFKSLLLPYNPNSVIFTSTYKTRTGQSGASFCDGMTEKTVPVAMSSESKELDRLLRFFDNCPKYTKDVKKNPETSAESNAYFKKHKYEVFISVSNKTGIPIANLTTEIIEGMWSACQSEVAVFDNADNWCSIFTARDAEIFEYAYDLSAYYTKGYGSEINYQIASPLISEIISNMEEMAIASIFNNSRSFLPRAQLRFGHAETVMPLLALLGLYKDANKLSSTWGDSAILNRKWRTSNISSLATNVAFVLYVCKDSKGLKSPYVEILHDENIVYLPGCNKQRLCPANKFKSIYSEYLNMNWTETCKSGSGGYSPNMFVMAFVALMMMFRII